MSPEEIIDVISRHEQWLKRKPGGARADLSGMNLAGFQLTRVNLQSAKLSGAERAIALVVMNTSARTAETKIIFKRLLK